MQRPAGMWARWINVALGVWLIISPYVLGTPQISARTNDLWLGILVAAIALIAMAVPAVRWVNVAAGIWLIIAPFVLSYLWTASVANDVAVGIAVLIVALVPTKGEAAQAIRTS